MVLDLSYSTVSCNWDKVVLGPDELSDTVKEEVQVKVLSNDTNWAGMQIAVLCL